MTDKFDRLLDKIAENANRPSSELIDSLKGQRPLGKGAEKIVYDIGRGNVVALFLPPANYGPEALKKRYYGQKLLHLALPNNIPDAHLAGSQPPMLILDRIKRGPDIDAETYKKEAEELERELYALGARPLDSHIGNFIRDTHGNMQYVDNVVFDLQPSGLSRAIKGLKEPEAKKAHYYASRVGIELTK